MFLFLDKLDCWVYWTLGWQHMNIKEAYHVFSFLSFCLSFLLKSLATTGFHWEEFFTLQNTCILMWFSKCHQSLNTVEGRRWVRFHFRVTIPFMNIIHFWGLFFFIVIIFRTLDKLKPMYNNGLTPNVLQPSLQLAWQILATASLTLILVSTKPSIKTSNASTAKRLM